MTEDFGIEQEEQPAPRRTRPGVVKLVLAAILAALFIGFILQNREEVPVEFLTWTWQTPMSLLLIATSIVAIIIWELAGYVQRRRKSKRSEQP